MSALPWDIGPICVACGAELALPAPGDALLDERGMAHLLCKRCGGENVVPFGLPAIPLQSARWKGTPRSAAALIWLVIIGLVLLMIPLYKSAFDPPPNQEPPRILLT